jgi:hypothetical protein
MRLTLADMKLPGDDPRPTPSFVFSALTVTDPTQLCREIMREQDARGFATCPMRPRR